MKNVQWSSADSDAAPVSLVQQNFRAEPQKSIVGNETVQNYRQEIQGVEIYGSFARVIEKNKDKEPVFVRAHYLESWNHSYDSTIKSMQQALPSTLEKLKKQFPVLTSAFFISTPKLVFVPDGGNSKLLYVVDWIDASGEQASRWFLNRRLKLVRQENRKSEFTTGRALVYPQGPRWSQIDRVDLPGLKGNGFLATDKLIMTTRASTVAQSTSAVFEYNEDDVRFDQVQVFHFVQAAMERFKTKYKFELEAPVEVITHIGFPEKKSVMFYFSHKINLGQGDDVTYKNIMWDPTIVTHELSHAFIDELAHLEQGSVNEAFADYFSCALTGRNKLGESSYLQGTFSRALDAEKSWTDLNGGTYNDSLVLSTLLWELRSKWGVSTADDFALKLLLRLDPKSKVEDVPAVMSALSAEVLTVQNQNVLDTLFIKRGWKK